MAKHKLSSYVVTYYCTYGLAARVQTCPSFVINARLSPSDGESMVLKRALTRRLGIRWPLPDMNERLACHCPPVALAVLRISIGKLQSRAQTFKLRHADKELTILLQYLNGAFGIIFLFCTFVFGRCKK